jgi:pimeloyl-ACP methyl ester carboxylesterase
MTDFLTIEGHRIAYTVTGSPSNPPILFLHGIMSHRGVWSRTIETFQQDFYCVAIDHLGFGDSDKPKDGDYSIAKQAERALKVASHFGFDKFSVIGHSMGGQIATYLASSLAPQRVRKLVSVDGVVTGKLSNRAENLNRLLIVVGEKIPAIYNLTFTVFNSSKPLAHWAFQVWFDKNTDLPFDSWEIDRRKATNPECAHSTPKAWDSLSATDLTPHLKNIVAPTLVIFGKQDGTVPVEQACLFKEQLPAAQLVVIENCGHFPMYEKFDEYVAPLKTFLKEQL